jgi:hypothetical protein
MPRRKEEGFKMHTHADRAKDNKSRAAANRFTGKQSDGNRHSTPVIQGFFEVESGDLKGYLKEQRWKQGSGKADIDQAVTEDGPIEPFTTVGFEAEFAQTTPNDNPLAGISHLVLSESTAPKMNYTGLDFVLETDAANAIELVTPPFLVRSREDKPLPLADDVISIDTFLREALTYIAESAGTIGGMEELFKSAAGIDFNIADVQVQPMHLSTGSLGKYGKYKEYGPEPSIKETMAFLEGKGSEPVRTVEEKEASTISEATLKDINVKLSEKGGGITTQVNFATDVDTFLKMSEIGRQNILAENVSSDETSLGREIKFLFMDIEDQIYRGLRGLRYAQNINSKLAGFLKLLSRNLAGQIAVPFIRTLNEFQTQMFEDKNKQKEMFSFSKHNQNKSEFTASAYLSSLVKDIDEAWIKDTLLNITVAMFPTTKVNDWKSIQGIVVETKILKIIDKLVMPGVKESGTPFLIPFRKHINRSLKGKWQDILILMNESLDYVSNTAINVRKNNPVTGTGPGLDEEVPFLGHEEKWITPRQDTFIHPDKVQITYWSQKNLPLHVVESRRNSVDMIRMLNESYQPAPGSETKE